MIVRFELDERSSRTLLNLTADAHGSTNHGFMGRQPLIHFALDPNGQNLFWIRSAEAQVISFGGARIGDRFHVILKLHGLPDLRSHSRSLRELLRLGR